jgi:hypothetical protein
MGKNKSLISGILGLLVIAAVLCFSAACEKEAKTVRLLVEKITDAQLAQCTLSGVTPGGVRYLAAYQPPAWITAAVDRGMSLIEQKAERYYHGTINRNSILIYLVPEERLSYGGVPSLTVPIRCDPMHQETWCNFEDYNKGVFTADARLIYDPAGRVVHHHIHHLTAAERVTSVTQNSATWTVIVPRVESPANNYLVESAMAHGGEHYILYVYDKPKFDSTIGAGYDVHPSLPLDDGRLIPEPVVTRRLLKTPDGETITLLR